LSSTTRIRYEHRLGEDDRSGWHRLHNRGRRNWCRRRNLRPQDAQQFPLQGGRFPRLGNGAEKADLSPGGIDLVHAAGAKQDDGHFPGVGDFAEGFGEFEAIHARHHHVDHSHVEFIAILHFLERFLT